MFFYNFFLSKAIITTRANILYNNLLILHNFVLFNNNNQSEPDIQNKEDKYERTANLNNHTMNNLYKKKKPIFKIEKMYQKQRTKSQMRMITKYKRRNRGSKYRGVSKTKNKWEAIIMINRQRVHLGCFNTEEEAAKAYDKVAVIFHKDKARTNFTYESI